MAHSSNLLLSSRSKADIGLLRQHLEPVEVARQQSLMTEGMKVARVYFPITAVVTTFASMPNGATVQSAMVGHDGMVGALPAIDGKIAFTHAMVQVDGHALVCNAADFKSAALSSSTLLSAVMRHEHVMFAHSQRSTACMALHSVTQRLARWMLRTSDLIGELHFRSNQEEIAKQLGVRRTSVTDAADELRVLGAISYSRGSITIQNTAELKKASCECYQAVGDFYKALWQ